MRTEKPWGYEEILFSNSDYTLKKLLMKAGQSCSLQYHQQKHETILVFAGAINLEFGPSQSELQTISLQPGDFFSLSPGTVHRMGATEDSIYYEASTSELDDVVRLDDRYGRI